MGYLPVVYSENDTAALVFVLPVHTRKNWIRKDRDTWIERSRQIGGAPVFVHSYRDRQTLVFVDGYEEPLEY